MIGAGVKVSWPVSPPSAMLFSILFLMQEEVGELRLSVIMSELGTQVHGQFIYLEVRAILLSQHVQVSDKQEQSRAILLWRYAAF